MGLWALLAPMACDKQKNRFDPVRYECAVDESADSTTRFVKIATELSPSPKPEALTAGLYSNGAWTRLKVNAKGCIPITDSAEGWLVISEPKGNQGVTLNLNDIKSSPIIPAFLQTMDYGDLSFSCEKITTTNQEFFNLTPQAESPLLKGYHLKMLVTDLDQKTISEQEWFDEIPVEELSVDLTALVEGGYSVSIKASELHSSRQGSDVETQCSIQLDRTPPNATPLELREVNQGTLKTSYVEPGEAIQIPTNPDQGSSITPHTCLYEANTPKERCVRGQTSLVNAPGSGEWILEYYLKDEAGNQSKPIEIPFTVINQDKLQTIRAMTQETNALLKSDQHQGFEAVVKAVKAEQTRQSLETATEQNLVLPQTREALLGAAFESKETFRFKSEELRYSAIASLPGLNRYLLGFENGEMEMREADGRITKKFLAHPPREGINNDVVNITVDPQGEYFLSTTYFEVRLFDRQGTDILNAPLVSDMNHWPHASVSNHGRFIATYQAKDEEVVLNVFSKDGALLRQISEPEGTEFFGFTADEEFLVLGSDNAITYRHFQESASDSTLALTGKSLIEPHPTQAGLVLVQDHATFQLELVDRTGQVSQNFEGHHSLAFRSIFSPDGERLASIDDHGLIRFWGSDGTLLATNFSHNYTGSLMSNNKFFVTSDGYSGFLKIWNKDGAFAGERRSPFANTNTNSFSEIAFAPGGERIMAMTVDRPTVIVWDTDQKIVPQLKGSFRVKSLAFSPNSQWLAYIEEEVNQVQLVNPGNEQEKKTLPNPSSLSDISFTDLVFTPDGRTLIASTFGQGLIRWSLDTLAVEVIPIEETLWVMKIHESTNKLYGSDATTIFSWPLDQLDGPSEVIVSNLDPSLIATFTLFPHEPKILVGGGAGEVLGFNMDGTPLDHSFENHGITVNEIVFDRDDQHFVTVGMDGFAITHHKETGTKDRYKPSDSRKGLDGLWALDIHPRSGEIVTGAMDGTWHLKYPDHDKVSKFFTRDQSQTSFIPQEMKFSPDGRYLAVASMSEIQIWPFNPHDLVVKSCQRLAFYLKHHPDVAEEDRSLCDPE